MVVLRYSRRRSAGSIQSLLRPLHKRRGPERRSGLNTWGRTPGKGTRVGREVIERMKADGRIIETKEEGKLQVVCLGGRCADLSATDMSHLEDAVRFWNREGFKHGPKSPEVREFMLDPKNYELEPSQANRSRGGKTTDRYRDPVPTPSAQPGPRKPD